MSAVGLDIVNDHNEVNDNEEAGTKNKRISDSELKEHRKYHKDKDESDMPLNLALHLRSLTENFSNKAMTERFFNNLLCFVAVVAYAHILRLGTKHTSDLQRIMTETFHKLIGDYQLMEFGTF